MRSGGDGQAVSCLRFRSSSALSHQRRSSLLEAAAVDPLGLHPLIFAALRRYVSFSSASVLKCDPPDWRMTACCTHDIGPDLLPSLAEPYRCMAVGQIRLAGLRHPNEVLDMAECLDAERVLRGEFGEALRHLGDGRRVALVPLVREIPTGGVPRSPPPRCWNSIRNYGRASAGLSPRCRERSATVSWSSASSASVRQS